MEKEELTPTEKALILLAKHIERCPYNEYKVLEEVLNELEIELVPKEVK